MKRIDSNTPRSDVLDSVKIEMHCAFDRLYHLYNSIGTEEQRTHLNAIEAKIDLMLKEERTEVAKAL